MHILLLFLPLLASAYDYQSAPEYQTILTQVKALGGFKEKPKSQGERMVEEGIIPRNARSAS